MNTKLLNQKTLNLNIFFSKQDLLKINDLFGINSLTKQSKEVVLYKDYFVSILNSIELKDSKIFKQLNKLISNNNFTEILFRR